MKDPIFIHYGSDRLNPNFDYSGYEKRIDKPTGLWASPVRAPISWVEWCMSEDYHTERLFYRFKFKLSPDTRILKIHNPKKFMKSHLGFWYTIDDSRLDLFNIYRDYDAMQIFYSQNPISFRNSPIFWSWDVDSICIWNLSKIRPLSRK